MGDASALMRDVNARHPWSHNDHFHSWILANLPKQRRAALDVGCGRGELLAALSTEFEGVVGADRDEAMREHATHRCGGRPNVTIRPSGLSEMAGPFDLVTMIAVLHHLDAEEALAEVRRLLAPRGRFLAVGLAPPQSPQDHLWDLASVVTNPIIGYIKHPWPNRTGAQPQPFPIAEPTMPFNQVHQLVTRVMPGAQVRHHLGFRHTIAWTKPD